ncbi:DUF2312 domain-containing protein [Sinorhizobium meliloti]|nr:DUF2312 domain-containing protein [Sinorhizobium meliloti]
MTNAHGIARDQLRAFIERIERLEEEKTSIADDIKDVYGEAKSMGFDAKILRKVISIRKQDADERAEQEAILDTYLHALGMIQLDIFEEPEAETSPKLVATVATAMQTQAGRAALLTAVDIMIDREERIDAETGEILDDQTEIASASQGETESPSAEAEASGANAGGGYVESSAERASVANNVANAAESVTAGETATNSIAKPKYVLRPHCLNPREACGGYSDKHCHACTVAMRKREQAEEVA